MPVLLPDQGSLGSGSSRDTGAVFSSVITRDDGLCGVFVAGKALKMLQGATAYLIDSRIGVIDTLDRRTAEECVHLLRRTSCEVSLKLRPEDCRAC